MGGSGDETDGRGGRGATGGGPPGGERIAKVLARRGLASRRGAEAMIAAGRVAVNGRVIESPALNVSPADAITVDGRPLPEPEPPRLWLYHKPAGLVTTEKDEKGRPTVFAALPPELGRVVSVGRLDLGSEGLLLLTNDGALKRRLELPATGWLRKYRVRVHGVPTEVALEPLRRGLTVDGERFLPMEVSLDRQQGANAWLTVGLREGRNREVRRAMEAVGLTVNRLIRISYGPFRLGELKPGEVEEVRRKVLREQLGLPAFGPTGRGAPRPGRPASQPDPRGQKRQRAAIPKQKGADRKAKPPAGAASGGASGARGPAVPPSARAPRPGGRTARPATASPAGPNAGPGPKGPKPGGPKGGRPRPSGPGRKR